MSRRHGWIPPSSREIAAAPKRQRRLRDFLVLRGVADADRRAAELIGTAAARDRLDDLDALMRHFDVRDWFEEEVGRG